MRGHGNSTRPPACVCACVGEFALIFAPAASAQGESRSFTQFGILNYSGQRLDRGDLEIRRVRGDSGEESSTTELRAGLTETSCIRLTSLATNSLFHGTIALFLQPVVLMIHRDLPNS